MASELPTAVSSLVRKALVALQEGGDKQNVRVKGHWALLLFCYWELLLFLPISIGMK